MRRNRWCRTLTNAWLTWGVLLVCGVTLGLSSGCRSTANEATSQAGEQSTEADEALARIGNDYLNSALRFLPLYATGLGLEKADARPLYVPNHALVAAHLEVAKSIQRELESLTVSAGLQSRLELLRAVVRYDLEAGSPSSDLIWDRNCFALEFGETNRESIADFMEYLASVHVIDSEARVTTFKARIEQIDGVIAAVEENMKAAVTQGLISPVPVIM